MKLNLQIIVTLIFILGIMGASGYTILSQLDKLADPISNQIPKSIEDLAEKSSKDGYAQLIRYYDEILTQSARNYAFTQDKKWEERYREAEPKLIEVIDKAIDAGDDLEKDFFSRVDEANIALVEMEYAALDLVNAGKASEAIDILESQEYWDYKNFYLDGLNDYVSNRGVQYEQAIETSTTKLDDLSKTTQDLMTDSRNAFFFSFLLILVALFTIAYLVHKTIINPIKSLTKTVSEIKEGTSKFEINPEILKSNDEIAVLAKTMQNQMNKIENSRRQLLEFKIALDEAAIVSILDMNEKISFVNDQFCKVSQFSRDELLGQSYKITYSGNHTPEFFKEIKKKLTSGETWRGEINNKAKDGSFYWLKSVIIPVLNEEKEITGYIQVATDITEIKKKEELLLKSDKEKSKTIEIQLEELKSVDKQKDEFVAMMSHELKTPITPIKIYSSSLKRPKMLGELNEKQMGAVDSIIFNTKRLEKIVGDLLDSQKLELGKMKFEKKEIKVDELMAMMTKNLISQTEEKGCQLINHTKEKNIIKSDASRLAQVLTNLMNNAIDFIPKDKGKIEINAQKSDDGILFSVKDNGIGMSLENQNKLFKKFFQTDTSIKRKHGGTGLGLAICKGIVEGLGGKIWLESEEGKGTNFYFTIPQEESK